MAPLYPVLPAGRRQGDRRAANAGDPQPEEAAMPDTLPAIAKVDSVTKLGPEHAGTVLFGGSHGGVYAGYCAAKAKVHAVLLCDAGVGKDEAGIGSLAYLDALGMAAATVSARSARIGDGEDQARRGTVSHVNKAAAAAGCRAGMPALACAELMRKAPAPKGDAPHYDEARFRFVEGTPEVWGIDSASLLRPEDAGQIVITASHGALLGGEIAAAIKYDVLACGFNDAGVGIDGIGITRLPALDKRGIAGVTFDCMTARIGDARSHWETGRVSHANETARRMGVKVGMSAPEFADAVRKAART